MVAQPQQPSQSADSDSSDQAATPETSAPPAATAAPETPATPAAPAPPETVPPASAPGAAAPRRTRISATWTAGISFTVVLLLLLIFILQNSRTVEISYLGAHGHLSLGVALLFAAVFGILLIALPGGARIIQLRAVARRHQRDAARLAARPADPAAPTGT